jgi:hypothetical protein
VPIDLSGYVLEELPPERDAASKVLKRENRSRSARVTRADIDVKISCNVGEYLNDASFDAIVRKSWKDPRWEAIMNAIITAAPTRRIAAVGRLQRSPQGFVSEGSACGGGGSGSILESHRFGFSNAVTVDCGQWLAVVHVTAQFLTHEQAMCQVMGKCPGDWWVTDAWWLEPDIWVDEFFGEWGAGIEPTEPALLCPRTTPGCLEPLETADSTKIEAALALIDTTSVPSRTWSGINVCLEARNRLRDLMNVKRLFRGSAALADIPNDPHDGSADWKIRTLRPGLTQLVEPMIHVDSDYLNSPTTSNSALAELLVHEAMHLFQGGIGHTETRPPYLTQPFNLAGACVA